MKKLLLLLLVFGLFSCSERSKEQFDSGPSGQSEWQDFVTDASGQEYPFLDPSVISYCGPGRGRKFCRFLDKYDGTIWADEENYFSDFSDIKFSNFTDNEYFISFFNIDSITSYCEGWKLGETTYDGIKWNIEIKRDQEDVLWFRYDYFGSGEEIEYSITYKYEVIDGLLNFSSTEGQAFVFYPSVKNYSEYLLDTGEIVRIEGCMFY